MQEIILVISVTTLVLIYIYDAFRKRSGTTTIYDYQEGLLYKKGKFIKKLPAGYYRYNKKQKNISVFDLRLQNIIVGGQEILTKDNVHIKLSIAAFFQIADSLKTVNSSSNYKNDLYILIQSAMRSATEKYELDKLLENREIIKTEVSALVKPQAQLLGLELVNLDLRDILLPGPLKKAYSGAIEAQKDALRDLEKARGEQAVLRKLANLAKMVEENPGLIQLRMLQNIADGKNITIVLGDSQFNPTKL